MHFCTFIYFSLLKLFQSFSLYLHQLNFFYLFLKRKYVRREWNLLGKFPNGVDCFSTPPRPLAHVNLGRLIWKAPLLWSACRLGNPTRRAAVPSARRQRDGRGVPTPSEVQNAEGPPLGGMQPAEERKR